MRVVQPNQITWRGLFTGAALVAALAFAGMLGLPNCFAADQPAHGLNRIQQENAREGTADWQLTRVRVDRSDGCRSLAIEGYCSKQSVAAGEKLQIMVSTQPAEKVRIEIFRTGYYGGRGARLMTTLGPFDGQPQPTPQPDERTMHECRWQPKYPLRSFPVPEARLFRKAGLLFAGRLLSGHLPPS